jgi:transmembrane sensor
MTPEKFKSLMTGYYAGTLTDSEKLELSALLHDPDRREQLQGLFTEDFADPDFKSTADTESLELIYQQVQLHKKKAAPVRKISDIRSFRLRILLRITAAAAVIVLLATASYFLFLQPHKPEIAKAEPALKNDVAAPSYTKAVLFLSDGRKIIIDSTINGPVATQGNITITKNTDGRLVYTTGSLLPADAQLVNTLTIPRGSRSLQLTLGDGTNIWLNAGSSITYPVAFAGNERKVQMRGEAYYEVAKDAARKFYVEANGIETEVLGTHFNVNAYSDEANVKVTLLEGKISVSAGSHQSHGHTPQILVPGQQAQAKKGDPVKVLDDVNTEEVVSWKEGFFDFNRTDIQSVMRQLARWYNVEVEYRGELPKLNFSGIINRSNNISQVLKMLQATGKVRFNIETGTVSGWAGKIIVIF